MDGGRKQAVTHTQPNETAWWEMVPGLVVAATTDGAPLYVSDAFRAAAGCREGDCGWLDGLEPGSRDELLGHLARRQDFSVCLRWQWPDAGARWLECTGYWHAGRAHHVCLFHDVTSGKTAELEARAQAEMLRTTADNVPALIAYYSAHDYTCLFANKQYAQTFGWDERSILGRTFAEVIGEDAAQEIDPHVQKVVRDRQPVSYVRKRLLPDGRTQWIEVSLRPHFDAQGEAIAAFVLIIDITRHRLAEQAVRESEERLAKFMQASAEGVVFHQDGYITDVNPPVCELVGYSREELLGRHTLDFISPEHRAKVAHLQATGQDATYESEIIHRSGERIPVEFIGRTMVRNGERLRMSIVRDIRDRHAAQRRIRHLAHHDVLTGLPNRLAFMEDLEHRLAVARNNDERLALLFIDLDNFKRVNDSLGHLVGDKLLQSVAGRLAGSLRSSDRVARFGGDEFLALLSNARRRDDVEDVARKLLAAVEVPIEVERRMLSVTPSIGIALFPDDAETPGDLVRHADQAMYLAKARGRANFQFFDPARADAAYEALLLEGELSQALDRGEFELMYQPQVRLTDGRPVGAEALLRWRHPQRGLMLPGEFLPAIENQRLMLPLGQWVLTEALRQALRWTALLGRTFPVAVNLSNVQFHASNLLATIERSLRQEDVPGHLLELELSERMLMDDLPEVQRKLQRLKQWGVQLAVDDFGTGYFSLRHLKELPIDKVKIDRSFVHDLPGSAGSAAIAQSIIQVARSMGHRVTAEGVENKAQRAFLEVHGCDEYQGFLAAEALPGDRFVAWMQERLTGPALA